MAMSISKNKKNARRKSQIGHGKESAGGTALMNACRRL